MVRLRERGREGVRGRDGRTAPEAVRTRTFGFLETSSARATSVGLKRAHTVPAVMPVPTTNRKGMSNRNECCGAIVESEKDFVELCATNFIERGIPADNTKGRRNF